MQKKKSNNFVFVLLSFVIIIVISLAVNTVRLFIKPTETTLVKNGELTKYEEVIGYIVRDETLVEVDEYEGIMQSEVEDATRIKKGGVVATFVSKSEEELIKKIKELDGQIQNAMESQQTIYTSDAKALDATIQIQIYENIKGNTNVNSLQENKNKLNANILKKAQIVGELSPVGSKLNKLITERNEYEKMINDAKKELITPMAGLVSYRIDGYENVLTHKGISDLTLQELDKLKMNANQVIPIDSNQIKIVNNFETYIVMFMNSEESKNAKLNDKLYLRFENTGDSLIPGTIEYISEESDGRLITVKIETNTEELTKYRKINLDVVWWSYTGFKLHKSLISKQEVLNSAGTKVATLDCVTIKKSSYNDIAYVKIVKEFGDYVIVDNYTDDEYLKMGFTEEEIDKFVTLKIYNEVLVNEK